MGKLPVDLTDNHGRSLGRLSLDFAPFAPAHAERVIRMSDFSIDLFQH